MTDIDDLKLHLQRDVAHSRGAVETQRLVLAFGQPFIGIKKPKGLRFGTRKMCFRNAANTVVCSRDGEKPSYVEGYACTPGIPPIHHAWIAFDDDHAVELTIRDDPTQIAYFGILFSPSEFSELLSKYQRVGFLDYPICPGIQDWLTKRAATLGAKHGP